MQITMMNPSETNEKSTSLMIDPDCECGHMDMIVTHISCDGSEGQMHGYCPNCDMKHIMPFTFGHYRKMDNSEMGIYKAWVEPPPVGKQHQSTHIDNYIEIAERITHDICELSDQYNSWDSDNFNPDDVFDQRSCPLKSSFDESVHESYAWLDSLRQTRDDFNSL